MANNIYLAVIILMLASCSDKRKEDKTIQETPKALEDKSASYDIVSKRGNSDLVESLYSELVIEDKDLKRLEDKVNELNSSKNDSIELFSKFNEKNQAYFSAAERHASEIKDSLLSERIKNMLALQLADYQSKIGRHKELLKTIEEKQLTLADLHTVLKIVRTLPLIDKYQKDNLPGTKSLDGYIKEQEAAIKLADSLAGK